MKRFLILISLIFISSCKNNTSEVKLENVTITDKTFIVKTPKGENVTCYLFYESAVKGEDISDEKLREILEAVNTNVVKDLIVPSSFLPIDYEIKYFPNGKYISHGCGRGFEISTVSPYGQTVKYRVRISLKCLNRNNEIVVEKYQFNFSEDMSFSVTSFCEEAFN